MEARQIICDICGAKIPKPDRRYQKRCVTGIKDVLSECQIIAARNRKKITTGGGTKTQNRRCLKCDDRFPSNGPYNRVCVKCDAASDREVRFEHRMSR